MRQAITGDPNKSIRHHMNEPPQVKMLDKASFTLGVSTITFSEYLIMRWEQYKIGGVINDPLSQTQSPANTDHYLKF